MKAQTARIQKVHDDLENELEDWNTEEIHEYFNQGYPSYWLAYDIDTLVRHAKLMKVANHDKAELTINTLIDSERGITEVIVYTADHPGLFSRIAGALASAGANVVDAKITTMRNGMALDSFWVQDANGNGFEETTRLSNAIGETLSGELHLTQLLKLNRTNYLNVLRL